MRRRATIKDVAALAGVSLKTVSRVINGEPGVSAPLAGRVEAAVAQLDYRHNLGASNLRRGQRTASIGVLLHDLRNAYSATLLHAIEVATRPRGIAVFSASLHDDDEWEAAVAADLISRRVDGLVLMPASDDQSYLVPDVRAGLAVVAVDRPARGADVDTVISSNASGAKEATLHLAAHGHRRIACLTDLPTVWTSAERRSGYEQGLAAAGLPLVPALVRTGLRESDDAAQAIRSLLALPDPPTALFTARNNLTIDSLRALHDLGLAGDVALVGFDDFPLADVVVPAVTVVSQDVDAIGGLVADLLLARMDGRGTPPRRVVVPTTLLVRGSGEVPPRPVPRPRPGQTVPN